MGRERSTEEYAQIHTFSEISVREGIYKGIILH
jgi:hypothetical protein